MKDKRLIRLWVILVVLCSKGVLCQDIEPGTLEPELPEVTTAGIVKSTTDTAPEVEISTIPESGSTTISVVESTNSSDVGSTTDLDSTTVEEVAVEVTSQSSILTESSSEEVDSTTNQAEPSTSTPSTETISSTTTTEIATTTDSPATTTETTTTTTTTEPCPRRVQCFYSLSRTRIMWVFTRICCSHCCYFNKPPYKRCRPVHLRHCGYPSFQPYYHDEEDDHIDSDYY